MTGVNQLFLGTFFKDVKMMDFECLILDYHKNINIFSI